jgi:RNA 2',3'-cyclic 3'-phosphodiesterase
MIRAFLGIDLPAEVRTALTVCQFLLPLPRRVAPETMHLTLVFLGEIPDATLEAAHDAFCGLKDHGFSLTLQGLGLFGGDRPRAAWAGVLPSAPLTRLQARAEQAARAAGCPVESRRFHPHVTLGRFPAAANFALERAVATTPFAAGPFEVRTLTLWESRLSPRGPAYRVLADYPLS